MGADIHPCVSILGKIRNFLIAFFEDFEQRQKGQNYAKRCGILSGLIFILKLFLCEVSISTYTQFSKKLHNTLKRGEFSVAS